MLGDPCAGLKRLQGADAVTPKFYLSRLLAVASLGLFLSGCNPPPPCGTKGDPAVPVGGAFSLIDHNGAAVDEKSYGSRYLVVYFGFTFCPDICPTELHAISTALDMLGKDADKIQPLFITVDPERDNVEAMAGYMRNFHPAIAGLTGSPDQIKQVAEAYRVYYAKAPLSEAPGDYTMNHTSYIYVIDCEGRYIRHISVGTKPEEIAEILGSLE